MKSSKFLCSSSFSFPADTYVYDVISVSGSQKLAVIASNDVLRLIDESLTQVLGAYDSIHVGVTCLENLDATAGCLVTAGRDAAVRIWDLRVASQTLQLSKGESCSGLSAGTLRWNHHKVLALPTSLLLLPIIRSLLGPSYTIPRQLWLYGQIFGAAFAVARLMTGRDCRSPKGPFVQYVESHNDDITKVYSRRFHSQCTPKALLTLLSAIVSTVE